MSLTPDPSNQRPSARLLLERVCEHNGVWVPISIAAGAASIVALRLAVDRVSAWQIFLLVAFGAAFGSTVLLILSRWFRRVDRPGLFALTLIPAALVAGGLGIKMEAGWLTSLGVLLLMIGLIANYEMLARTVVSAAPWVTWAGLGLLACGALLMGSGSFGVIAAGVGIWVVGLTLFKLGLPSLIRSISSETPDWLIQLDRRARHTLLIALGFAGIGVGLLAFGPLRRVFGEGVLATAVGVTLIFAGLSAAAIAALHWQPDRSWSGSTATSESEQGTRRWLVVALVGGLLVAGASLWVRFGVIQGWSAAAFVIVLLPAVVGAFFVFRGEGLVLLTIVGFVLAWVLVDRTAEPAQLADQGDGIVVVLGDSFSSGQGARRYLAHTNSQDASANTCRRSPDAYGFLTGYQLNRRVYSYACSGAASADIVRESGERDATVLAPGGTSQLADVSDERFGVSAIERIDLILLTIGGNDAGFSRVVTACVLPTRCDDDHQQWLARVDLIHEGVRDALIAIKRLDGLRGDVPVVVLAYPSYVGDRECDRSLTDDELSFGTAYLTKLNRAVADAVDAANVELSQDDLATVRFFGSAEVDGAFHGRRICDSHEPNAANFINLVPRDGPFLERLSPVSWHEGTMHPNEIGHECLSVRLMPWLLREFPQLTPSADPVPEAPIPECDPVQGAPPAAPIPFVSDEKPATSIVVVGPDGSEITCIADSTRTDECFDEGVWTEGRLQGTVQKLAVPLALLIGGGLLTSLGLARARVRWLRLFTPDAPSPTPRPRLETVY